MEFSETYTFTRYLSSKKTVDDRALNRHVFDSFKAAVAEMKTEQPLRVLEIGAGIGTMIERALDWELLNRAEYTALDAQSENITEACRRLPVWAEQHRYDCRSEGPGCLCLVRDRRDVSIRLETADIFDFIALHSGKAQWDVLIANAFLDLVDVPSALPLLLSLLKPGGLFYFTITFDGGTILQPEIDPILDGKIEDLYHETMDQRIITDKRSGDSRTGRHFFQHARSAGAEILAAGSSDWTVFAGPDGYPADEAFFLHFIVHTIGSALAEHPDLDEESFRNWVKKRHEQVDEGTLVYIAHQMDFFGRIPYRVD